MESYYGPSESSIDLPNCTTSHDARESSSDHKEVLKLRKLLKLILICIILRNYVTPSRKADSSLFGQDISRLSGYVRRPLWPSEQSSWLQIYRFGLDSRRYQIFWEVAVLERGTLSLVSRIEELLERK
jgi:hypothetical protein